MQSSQANLVLPNIYGRTRHYGSRPRGPRLPPDLASRLHSHFGAPPRGRRLFKGLTHEAPHLAEGPAARPSLHESLAAKSRLDPRDSRLLKNDSLVRESRFSVRNGSLQRRDSRPRREAPDPQSKNTSKGTLSRPRKEHSDLLGVSRGVFGERGRPKNWARAQLRPLRERLRNRAAEAPDERKRRRQKENLARRRSRKSPRAKERSQSAESYSRELFRQAFREVDSIFSSFASLYEVGSGSYAVAYSAVEKQSGRKVVLKTFRFRDFVKKSYASRFMVR